jgi:hypothetical protein
MAPSDHQVFFSSSWTKKAPGGHQMLCFTYRQQKLHSTATRCYVLFVIDENCTWWPPGAFFSSLGNF